MPAPTNANVDSWFADGVAPTKGNTRSLLKDGTRLLITATGSTTERNLATRFAEQANVKDFGALGDGSTDDTSAFDDAGAGAYMPPGDFVVDIDTLADDTGLHGPGEVEHLDTWRTVGQRAQIASYGDPLQTRIRQVYGQADATTGRKTARLVRSTTQTIATATWTAITWTVQQDGFAANRPSVSNDARIYVPYQAKEIRFDGVATFASDATSARGVAIYKNGSSVDSYFVAPVSGAATGVPFNFVSDCTDGDYFEVRVWQGTGGNLDISGARVSAEITYQHPRAVPGKRLLIFQGTWEDEETSAGSYRALVDAVAQYDVLAISHVEAFGAGIYPALPNPNGIQDGGYKKLKRLIHDYKDRNPRGIVFGYISAAIDCPNGSWDVNGNPTTNAWTSTTYPNLVFWMDLWTDDRHLPIDGFFLDHFNSSFMSATARDAVAALVKNRGKKIMANITTASTAAVQWAAECADLTWGDYLCIEGFYRDNGVDSSSGTTDAVNAMAKLETRGLLMAAVCEESSGTTINNAAANNTNAKVVFNAAYKPGWCYQYGRVTYDQVGTPGI